MNTTELETAVRESAGLGDASAYPDLTAARIYRELNDKLRTVFEDMVTKSRSGYWLHEFIFSTTIGRNRYRIPHRSVVGGLEAIQVAQAVGQPFYKIEQVPAQNLPQYEGAPGTGGPPIVYAVIGDQIEIVQTPTSVYPIKFIYYARPSQLYAPQNNTPLTGGTDRGRITTTSTVFPDLTVNTLPFDMSLAVPAVIVATAVSGKTVDIVKPNGWHELSMIGNNISINSPTSVTISSPTGAAIPASDLIDVEVGDYIRISDQTDWPCLPVDFHRCLADTAAIKILLELHLTEKSDAIAANNGNDLARFRALLYPRVKNAPKQVGIMRRSRGSGPYNGGGPRLF